MITLRHETVEALTVGVRCDTDPLGDVVAFALVNLNTVSPTWVTGAWVAGQTWTSASVPVYAVTPTLGAAAALPAVHGTYTLLAQITDNPEVPVLDCGSVRFT